MRAVALGAIEILICLLGAVMLMVNPDAGKAKPAIETLGRYAIDMTWPGKLDQDMDLWVQDPDGNVVWFQSRDAGYMSLQHDDLGRYNDPTNTNHERVILRWAVEGEYVVNVHAYRKDGTAVTPVRVTLTRLAGADEVLYSRTVDMRAQGDEQTAFRFRLDRGGRFAGTNTLAKSLVYQAQPAPGTP